MSDPVHEPAHYKGKTFEVLEVIEAYRLGYHLGNVFKYVARHEKKGRPTQDIGKGLVYLNRFQASSELQRVQSNAWINSIDMGIIRGTFPGAYAIANDFGLIGGPFLVAVGVLLLPSTQLGIPRRLSCIKSELEDYLITI